MTLPKIIQGGMGAGVSDWRLARAVAQTGQLGVVSGTALATILARRLQLGDLDGQIRRALENFPVPGVAERVLVGYYIPGGKSPRAPFKLTPLPNLQPGADYVALTVAANFVEVFLAKEGHAGLVGINFLEKIQFPTLPSLFGAMLAGVDCVLISLFDLAENLRFPNDHGVQARCYAEQMLDSLGVGVSVEMAVQSIRRKLMKLTQEPRQTRDTSIGPVCR